VGRVYSSVMLKRVVHRIISLIQRPALDVPNCGMNRRSAIKPYAPVFSNPREIHPLNRAGGLA
jgi:hypothetical protein